MKKNFRARTKNTTILLILILATTQANPQDWPQYMHDNQHTGTANKTYEKSLENIKEKWNYQTDSWMRSSPTAADIDGDGTLEILFGSDDKNLRALDSNGRLLWSYRTEGKIRSTPLAADITGDGRKEVIFGSEDGTLYALDDKGNTLWKIKTGGAITSSAAAGYFSPKPGLEVAFTSTDGFIYVASSRGEILWKYETAEPIHSSPAIADIDGDGLMEVIVGSNDNTLYVMKNPTKILRYQTNGDITGSPAVADVDSDGKQEIIIGSSDGTVYCLNEKIKEIIKGPRKCTPQGCFREDIEVTQLSPKWEYKTDGQVTASPIISDLDLDGRKEVIVGSEDDTVYVLSYDGEKIKRFTANKPISVAAASADFNGDGLKEIAFATVDGRVFVLDSRGERIWETQINSQTHTTPALADLKGDGTLDIIISSDDNKIHVFESELSAEIQNALQVYERARKKADEKDLDSARILAEQARLMFEKAGHATGLNLVGGLFERIDADELMRKAREEYGRGDYENASHLLYSAVEVYTRNGLEDSLKEAEKFFARIDADTLLYEGTEALKKNDYAKAQTDLEDARKLYEYIGYDEGVEQAIKLMEGKTVGLEVAINKSIVKLRADTAYTRAWSSFYKNDFDESIKYAALAEEVYLDAGDGEGAKKSAELLKHARADTYYGEAVELEVSGEQEEVVRLLNQALALYREIDYGIGILRTQSQLNRTETLYLADETFREALERFNAADYGTARELAVKALEEYQKLGDTRGVERSEFLVQESEKEGSSQSHKRVWFVALAVGCPLFLFFLWRFREKLGVKRPSLTPPALPKVRLPKARLPEAPLQRMDSIRPPKMPGINFTAPKLPKKMMPKLDVKLPNTRSIKKASEKIRKKECKLKKEIVKPEADTEEARGRKRIKFIQKETKFGGPIIASSPEDLFLMLLRLREKNLGDYISSEDAAKALGVRGETLDRWVKRLECKGRVKVFRSDEGLAIRLSDSVIQEENKKKGRGT